MIWIFFTCQDFQVNCLLTPDCRNHDAVWTSSCSRLFSSTTQCFDHISFPLFLLCDLLTSTPQILKLHCFSPEFAPRRGIHSFLKDECVCKETEEPPLLFFSKTTIVCRYLGYETVQLTDSVPVWRVCGQPLGDSWLSIQLVSDFHLLPENRAWSHISTGLGRTQPNTL